MYVFLEILVIAIQETQSRRKSKVCSGEMGFLLFGGVVWVEGGGGVKFI